MNWDPWVLLGYQVEDFMYHVCCFIVSSFEIFCFDSFAADVPLLRLSIAILSYFMVNSWMCLSCSSSSTFFINVSMVTSVFKSCFAVLLVFSSSLLLQYRSFWNFSNTLAMPFLVASMFPASFLICVMRIFFFLILMLAIDLIPFNSSRRIFCTFSCLLDLSLPLTPFLIFLLMSLTWALPFLSIFFLFR